MDDTTTNNSAYDKLENLCKEMTASLQRLKEESDRVTSPNTTPHSLLPYTIEPDSLKLFVDEDHLEEDPEYQSTIQIKLIDIK